jgi:hypothetical protein
MRTMRRLLTIAALLFVPTGLCAQEVEGESTEALRKRIDERIQQMRDAIRDGLPITTNVRVTVKLRNNHRMSGVVKNGRFVEKVHGLDFVPSDLQTPGAGIRVWYYDNTDSYIFLPFEAIASYKIGARLTEVQLKQIEDSIEKKRRDIDQSRVAATQKRQAEEGREAAEKAEAKKTAAAQQAEGQKKKEEERLRKLLAEFPPEQGWGADKLAEIEKRKIVLGVFPDDRSRRFTEVFDDWQEAVRLQQERDGEAEAMPARPPGGIVPPSSGDGRDPTGHGEPPTEIGDGDAGHGDAGHGDDGDDDGGTGGDPQDDGD